jgi:hypothetical protein
MGFYIYIYCQLNICKDTGKHFYYGKLDKIYDIPQIIPEEYREFISMSGKVFRIYTNLITDDTLTSVENFVDKYPLWTDIIEDSDFEKYCNFWNEDKHKKFYDALKWFSEQDVNYMIGWSN